MFLDFKNYFRKAIAQEFLELNKLIFIRNKERKIKIIIFSYNCYLWLLEQKLKTELTLSFIMAIPTSVFPIFLNSTSNHPAAKAKTTRNYL